jgi:hypothetical protein
LEKENRIIDRDLDHYNTSHVVFKPARMSPGELKNGYLWIYREFYSWKRIMERMPDSREQLVPYLLFNLVYRKYGNLFSFFGKAGMMPAISGLARKFVRRRPNAKSTWKTSEVFGRIEVTAGTRQDFRSFSWGYLGHVRPSTRIAECQ